MRGAWSGAPKLAGSAAAYGYELPASLTGQPRNVSHWDLSLAAARQVSRVTSPLTRAQDAEDVAIMWSAPQDLEHALYLAAYWVAVAGRVEGRSSLGAIATRYLAEGKLRANAPGRNQDPDRIKEILQGAAGTVSDPFIKSVLLQGADPERQALTRERSDETSPRQLYVEPLLATINTFRDPGKWPWYAWAAGIGVLVLFGGALILGSSRGRQQLVQGVRSARRGLGSARGRFQSARSTARGMYREAMR